MKANPLRDDVKITVRKPGDEAGSLQPDGSAAALQKKLTRWTCKCGCLNWAPADQSGGNVVTCYECETMWFWRQVLKMQKPPNVRMSDGAK